MNKNTTLKKNNPSSFSVLFILFSPSPELYFKEDDGAMDRRDLSLLVLKEEQSFTELVPLDADKPPVLGVRCPVIVQPQPPPPLHLPGLVMVLV